MEETVAKVAPEKKFSMFREELTRVLKDLRGGALTPRRAAISVALGLFIGSQPIFGCHTPLVIAICLWFQLDAALAWIASNVSNPFFAPFLMTGEVQVGAYLRRGSFLHLDQEVMRDGFQVISKFAGYLFLGSPFVGLALAGVGAGLTLGGVAAKRAIWPSDGKREPYRLPDNAPPWVKAVERTAGRYVPPEDSTPQQRTRFHYVRIKMLSGPIALMLAEYARSVEGGLGELCDVGTGAGQLPILLHELGLAGRVHGVDWDEAKIADAQAAAKGRGDAPPPLDAHFFQGDAREAELPASDSVLLIDLLHYFRPEEQEKIVRNAASAVRTGGRVLIREADTEQGWRSFMTLAEERFFTLVRFNRGERVRFLPARARVKILEEMGFSCEIRPAWGKTPFSNVLILGTRKEPARRTG
jgi:SAM-dependent methyltransferase